MPVLQQLTFIDKNFNKILTGIFYFLSTAIAQVIDCLIKACLTTAPATALSALLYVLVSKLNIYMTSTLVPATTLSACSSSVTKHITIMARKQSTELEISAASAGKQKQVEYSSGKPLPLLLFRTSIHYQVTSVSGAQSSSDKNLASSLSIYYQWGHLIPVHGLSTHGLHCRLHLGCTG
jgi:hypothetical protein